jgi:hypothetical protein
MMQPALSSGLAPTASTFITEAGIAPSFCLPCIPVVNQQLCGLPFSPHFEPCDGGGGCIPGNIGPCIPFINKQLRCCFPGGCSLVDC